MEKVMSKKLVKYGNQLALILGKTILRQLDINEKTTLELTISEGILIVKPALKKAKQTKASGKDVVKAAERIMKKYGTTFKKLAKT